MHPPPLCPLIAVRSTIPRSSRFPRISRHILDQILPFTVLLLEAPANAWRQATGSCEPIYRLSLRNSLRTWFIWVMSIICILIPATQSTVRNIFDAVTQITKLQHVVENPPWSTIPCSPRFPKISRHILNLILPLPFYYSRPQPMWLQATRSLNRHFRFSNSGEPVYCLSLWNYLWTWLHPGSANCLYTHFHNSKCTVETHLGLNRNIIHDLLELHYSLRSGADKSQVLYSNSSSSQSIEYTSAFPMFLVVEVFRVKFSTF